MTAIDVPSDEIDHLPFEDDRQLPQDDGSYASQAGETASSPQELNARVKEFQSSLGNAKLQGQID